ncbi:uncharacterized protein LOC120261317 [Dioscorea cayenensis subsp. rotundata]|uniref:Uncharacterized protein LOC120261317 n=1 Tax=Dioscorea cayennensis subsp. rotundata TaxID=55577 RepID=A0AB40BD27_DIOCR|nr:uncharacterized protein LOC120261317 [Dioscorea cayenensis subsp. rotundata]
MLNLQFIHLSSVSMISTKVMQSEYTSWGNSLQLLHLLKASSNANSSAFKTSRLIVYELSGAELRTSLGIVFGIWCLPSDHIVACIYNKERTLPYIVYLIEYQQVQNKQFLALAMSSSQPSSPAFLNKRELSLLQYNGSTLSSTGTSSITSSYAG